MMQVIYRTKGRAKEFCELAINIYTGCAHGCVYCYGPDVTRVDRRQWYSAPHPRITPKDIKQSAMTWKEKGPVLLCFVCDPYQPIEADLKYTQLTIELLNYYDFPVHILTKAGSLAQRDFGRLQKRKDNAFAVTLTTLDPEESREWEPGAGLPDIRIHNLIMAHRFGIQTWVSLEPVISPSYTFEIIRRTHEYVGHYKVGKMNYHPLKDILDWNRFAEQAIELLNMHGARYYIKKDLAKYLGKEEGCWGGSDVD